MEEKTIDLLVIGKTTQEAIELIKTNGCLSRIIMEDGNSNIVTMDLRSDRLNLKVVKGVVVEASRG